MLPLVFSAVHKHFPMQIPTYISCILVVYCRVFWAVFSNTNLFSVTPRHRELLAELSIKFLRVCTRWQETKKDHPGKSNQIA